MGRSVGPENILSTKVVRVEEFWSSSKECFKDIPLVEIL